MSKPGALFAHSQVIDVYPISCYSNLVIFGATQFLTLKVAYQLRLWWSVVETGVDLFLFEAPHVTISNCCNTIPTFKVFRNFQITLKGHLFIF